MALILMKMSRKIKEALTEALTILLQDNRNSDISDLFFYIKNHLPVIKVPKPQLINYLGKQNRVKNHKQILGSSRNIGLENTIINSNIK